MERGTGKEKVIHIALSKLRDLTYPPQMQTSEKHTHTHTKNNPTSPIQTQIRTQSACLFPLSPLLQSCDRKDLDSCEQQHFTHAQVTHKKTNVSHPVNTEHCTKKKKKKCKHTVTKDTDANSQGKDTLCKTDAQSHTYTHTAAHKNFPQYAHPLSDRSRPQIEPICIFKRRLRFCIAPSVKRQTRAHSDRCRFCRGGIKQINNNTANDTGAVGK